ncbi:MAG: hypothetical protein G8345_14460 [Magnetococcales bacterium]|nr:hypothetical protein [Magnetococcales bacterium]MBF0613039.1 hypothetical protein [Magnetococcales bacterium]NGZ28078.1 hypothetical protein [Magnetococcales bacterium]
MFPLNMMQSWNRMCDSQFYDVSALTGEERKDLSVIENPEGAIIVVYPAKDKRNILHYQLDDFISELVDGQLPVRTIAIAGVGSSALGTAALSRNIADYIGEPVCGIISGMGMVDLLTEGLGGWYVLGARNMIRDWVSRSFSMSGIPLESSKSTTDGDPFPEHFVPGSPDSLALLKILLVAAHKLRLIVGHSKGNYIIENAMEGYVAFCRQQAKAISDFQIVTLSALVRFPSEIKSVKQVIGGMDFFGAMNSRPFLDAKTLPLATHTTNPERPFPLIVAKALEVAGIAKKN